MKNLIKEKIREWIVDSIRFKEYEPSAHWHIDDFDVSLQKNTSQYFDKGIKYLQYAEEIVNEIEIPFFVSLVFPLNPRKRNIKKIFIKSKLQLTDDLFVSPAIYLEHKSTEYENRVKFNVSNNEIKFMPEEIKCIYSEQFDKVDGLYYGFLIFYVADNFFIKD